MPPKKDNKKGDKKLEVPSFIFLIFFLGRFGNWWRNWNHEKICPIHFPIRNLEKALRRKPRRYTIPCHVGMVWSPQHNNSFRLSSDRHLGYKRREKPILRKSSADMLPFFTFFMCFSCILRFLFNAFSFNSWFL